VQDDPDSNTDLFLSRDTLFLHLSRIGLFGKNELFSIYKILICRKYSFQTLTQFSQRHNVIDAAASNRDGFL
jgi:hypothetical protein